MQQSRSRTIPLCLFYEAQRFLADEHGQAATEYVLVIGLISIPIYVAFQYLFKKFLHDFIAAVITTFTRG
jgi:Flp pilus assembly pilin Flp